MHVKTTAENLSEAINYLCLVTDHVASNRKFTQTVKGISKQAGFGVAGTVVGGVCAGPLGAAVGSFVGASIGYAFSSSYDGVLQYIQKMSDEEKADLVRQIRELVGANPIASFYTWYVQPANQETMNALFITVIGLAAATSSQSTVRN